jgi:hypothetical protein
MITATKMPSLNFRFVAFAIFSLAVSKVFDEEKNGAQSSSGRANQRYGKTKQWLRRSNANVVRHYYGDAGHAIF